MSGAAVTTDVFEDEAAESSAPASAIASAKTKKKKKKTGCHKLAALAVSLPRLLPSAFVKVRIYFLSEIPIHAVFA